jgi:hypothetical protein
MISTNDEQRPDMATLVKEAELEVARTKRLLHESLRLASETGSRLAREARRKATPALLVAVALGVAVAAGATLIALRNRPTGGRRVRNQPSLTADLARAAGIWMLRAAALRLGVALTERLGGSMAPPLPALAVPPSHAE